MNYKKIEIVSDIQNYHVRDGNLLCRKKDGSISLNGNILLAAGNFSGAFFLDAKVIVYGNADILVKSNLETGVIEKLNPAWSYKWDTFKGDEIIISMNRRKSDNGYPVADYYKYNFSTDRLTDLKLTSTPNLISDSNHGYFVYNNSMIRKYNLDTGEQLWQNQLSETVSSFTSNGDYTIKEFIGIHSHQILLSLTSDDLLGLSTDSGKVLWHSNKFVNKNLLQMRPSPVGSFYNWHAQDGKLYQFEGDTYLSFDVLSGESQWLWQDKREKNFITVINKTYTNRYIYFTASLDERVFPTRIGVFDRTNLNIAWIHEVEQISRSLNDAPQVDGNELYVLDGGGALHIYKADV